jgi:hydroxypyruvate reductase
MASEAESVLGPWVAGGLVVDTSDAQPLDRLPRRLAGHPVPDARGLRAAREVERLAGSLERDDLLLVLLSGGASALLPAPVHGLTLRDKACLTSRLMAAGASIHELNAVRKHLSRLKGGGLARLAAPARVACLALSDVVGDDLATIASGPTVPDTTRFADALEIVKRRLDRSRIPARALAILESGVRGEQPETAKPGDPWLRRARTRVIGSNRLSVEAAARTARRLGFRPRILTTSLEGEAREVAAALVAILRECVEHDRPVAPPVCLIAGGETTVTVLGSGHGGRNQEIAAAAAIALDGFGAPAVVASLATDGVDGRSDAAGGLADDTSESRAREQGVAAAATFLAASDSRNYLASLDDLIVLGPTGTNVMDVVVLLAGSAARL